MIGVGADQHAAAVTAGVAERRQSEIGDDLALAVEYQPKRQQPQLRQLGHDRQVVAHPAVRPAHPIDAVADQGIEAGCRNGPEPGSGAVGGPNMSEVDGFGVTGDDHIDCRRRVANRYAVLASVVITGAGRDDAQWNAAVRQRL